MEKPVGNSARAKRAIMGASILACAIFAGGSWALAQTTAQLEKPDPKDWLSYGGNYNSQRYSLLKQVTAANAKNLQVKWIYRVPGARDLESVPIVSNGVMYIPGYNRMDAIDARSGNVIWRYQRLPASQTVQRGTAIYDGKLFIQTSDAHLVALDARNGSVLWDVKTADGRVLSGAGPFVAKGKVIVGNSAEGIGGAIQAYDAQTGKHLWTWNAVPKAGDPGSETWSGDPQKLGGGAIWHNGSFDPEQNLLIWGTGSPPLPFNGEVREGDNHYVGSIVAIDVDTGKLKWFFQNTPHDEHDWDSHESMILVDAVFQGRMRKLVLQAHRNGFYYIIDRTNGKFLQGTPIIDDLNWASGLTPEGRPILLPGFEPSVKGTRVCPPTSGATNWPSHTYDPQTRYLYFQAVEGCALIFRGSSAPGSGGGYLEDERNDWQSYVRAIDAFTGKRMWEYKEVRSNHYGPGLLSTAGGIIFAPEQFGQVTMLDARSGKVLWHFNTGDLITASPVTYSVNGRQFFAVEVNGSVIAFGLPDVGGKS